MSDVTRRRFIVASAAAGAGLSIGVLPFAGAKSSATASSVDEVNAWVVIHPDDTVVIRIARSEMGQGTLTGLAQMVAEELECDWDKVGWEYPTPRENLARDRVWKNYATGGSRGIRESNQYVREGGAAARMMLIEAAAARWNVDVADCRVDKGVISNKRNGKTLRYGEVAAEAAGLAPPMEVKLKDPSEWTLIGQPKKRLDTAGKLDGSQQYGSDVQLPGMLNASIKACPVFGGKLEGFNADEARKMPGVRDVVSVGDNAVAVVADAIHTYLRTTYVQLDAGYRAADVKLKRRQHLLQEKCARSRWRHRHCPSACKPCRSPCRCRRGSNRLSWPSQIH